MSEYTKGLKAEQLIEYIANDYVELSHEKIVVQRNDFMTVCREWLQKNLSETRIKQKDYNNKTLLRCPRCWESEMVSNRPWVGLTEQEQGAIMEDLNAHGTNLYPFAQAVEAKLKEKNTNA